MKTKFNLLVAGMFLAATSSALATVRYVNVNNANPTPPYTNWATAATNIQNAVNAAGAGDEILVTNGTYAPVTVNTPLTLQSVNGPGVTVIQGGGGVRCLYLTNNAVMVGFTLTNGSVSYGGNGGGVYCESTNAVLTNCVLTGNSAEYGGGAYGGTLNNCTLAGNSANGYPSDTNPFQYYPGVGGGAYACTLNNCTLTGNSASDEGGGAADSTLNNCTLTGNSAGAGGGAGECMLNNCTLSGNSVSGGRGVTGGCGGGVIDSTLNNCTLTDNTAQWDGGGAWSCTLNNCTLTGNSADGVGGGACGGTLNNCTLTGNSARQGGGAYSCTLNNCIVYFNSDPNGGNYDPFSTLNYCCTTPMPTNGVGNITNDPAFVNAAAGSYHLSSGSPCINAGNNAYVVGSTDLDGRPRIIGGTVDIGAYEYRALLVWSGSPSPVPPYATWATAATNIQEAVDASLVGDNILVTNGTYATGGEEDANGDFDIVVVDKPLVLSSVNGPSVTVINGGGVVRCVYLTNDAVMVGFTLTNGLAYIGGEQGGGVYCESTSAVLTNCVLSGNTASGCDGGGAYGGMLNNCTLTGNTANREYYDYHSYGGGGGGTILCTLNNCTLTGNYADEGGGVYSCILNNCTLTGNSAFWPGGGAYSCTLNNCTLTGNSSVFVGGGANGCTLNNCTVTGNSGCGASYCTLNNCIVYFNSDPNGGNYDPSSTLNYCCTTPLPTNGVGNITNAPLFVNYAGGNLRLQTNSPCINSGNNAYVVGSTDLDGHPRIVFGTVDIGAYEYQTPTSIISYAWLQQYGLPTDGSADHADLDGTGMNVYQDWVAGLNPANALSVLKMTSATKTNNPAGLVVTWESVNTRTYYLQSSTNLAAQPAFSTIQSNIVGQAGTTSYTDTNAVGSGPFFYRVGVGN
jgi:parallel beta-helix repeat protein